jgi:hypothetical protein
MKFISTKNFWVLNSLLLGEIILQILDFPKPFNFPWIIGIGKFLLFISVPLYVFRLDNKLKTKLTLSLIYLILIVSTYSIPFWKIKANFYLSNIQTDYSEVVDILKEKGSFGRIFYNLEADSLKIISSNENNFSKSELSTIKIFMKENWYIEIWKERFGVALIHDRFLDNRRGFILCENQECRDTMDSNEQSNESYQQFNDNWYYFSSR